MAPLPSWLLRLAGHDVRRELDLARSSRSAERRAQDEAAAADENVFRRHAASVGEDGVHVGTTETDVAYTISLRDLTSLPSWATAATGAGKSRFVGGLLEDVVVAALRGDPVSIVLVDGKGESADQLLRSLAALAARLGSRVLGELRRRLHTFRFFDPEYLPSWPLLVRIPGVAIESQADAVAEVLNDLVSDATIGPRQRATLAAIIALAIEFGIPLAALPWLLSAPPLVSELADRSTLLSVRLQLARFEREAQGSIDGLIARLSTILRVPSLRAAVSGPTPFDFGNCFEPGSITVFDFGRAELGARSAVRAMGSLAISALANAAFDPRRTVRGTTLIAVDEPQMLMTSVTLAQFERLITLGRSFGAGGLMLLHQGATQLPQDLQSVLNTNVVMRIVGRSSARDAAASSEWLPQTGRVRRPRTANRRSGASPFLSEGEEERFRINEIGRLEERHFLVSDRRAPFAPRVIRARDYDPPPWSAIPRGVADLVRRGSQGIPRAELEEHVRAIEETAAGEVQVANDNGGPRRGPRVRVETPDVVGERPRRRRGGVP